MKMTITKQFVTVRRNSPKMAVEERFHNTAAGRRAAVRHCIASIRHSTQPTFKSLKAAMRTLHTARDTFDRAGHTDDADRIDIARWEASEMAEAARDAARLMKRVAKWAKARADGGGSK